MRAAFEARVAASESVLSQLRRRADSRLDLQLHAVDEPSDVLVTITEEAKALRDPSGRYQILGEIGRGGVGIVYKGRDQDLGRDVAMKVLKDEYAVRPDILARFVEEAQIGGQLQHPGIVPVYELGLQAGERPYFAMKLVKGETLAAQFSRRRSPQDERRRLLGVFEQVCQTVAYAHARRVVHRDLKPANVMIGAFGEVQVVDWGFAKVLRKGGVADEAAASMGKSAPQRSVIETVRSQPGSGSQSIIGSMMGTPAYMPPEQAQGDIERVDERSDVFALGAILCEVLSGEAPYVEEDGDLVRQAANAALDGARRRLERCGADAALIEICLECLAPAQRARPSSAGEVAERVGAYLTSVEERARQAEVKAAEARLRHRVTLLASVAALLLLGAGAFGWIHFEKEAQERRAGAAQRVAAAMSAASGARGRAQSGGLDSNLWSAAVTSAEQAVSLATGEDVDAGARAEAEALLESARTESAAAQAESDRRARDAAMLERLETLRMPVDEDLKAAVAIAREHRRLDAEYASAFGDYMGGDSLFSLPVESALESLRRGEIEVELATSLDHWALVRDSVNLRSEAPDPAGTARLREIATRLDADDAWRSELRALLPRAADEGDRLRALAASADFASLSPAGCRVLSVALGRARDESSAVDVLRRGREAHPQSFDVCFRLAMSIERLDEPPYAEALAALQIAQALRPERNEVLHRQGIALEKLGRHADAERAFRPLLRRQPESAHWLNHVALSIAQQGRPEEAIPLLERALGFEPDSAASLGALAFAFEKLGRLDEALATRELIVKLQPRSAEAVCNLGLALEAQGRRDEAIANYRIAIEIDPRYSRAYGSLGFSLTQIGRLEEAESCIRRALEIDPRNASALCDSASLLRAQGRLDDAIATYRRSIAIDPGSSRTLLSLGGAFLEAGRLEEAIAYTRRAVEIDPRSVKGHCNLGTILGVQGKSDEAIASLERAIELDPRAEEPHYRLGDVLGQLGRVEEAIAAYRTALEIDPLRLELNNNLANLLVGQGRPDEAVALYRRALEGHPWQSDTVMNLGFVLQKLNRVDEAIALYRQALEANPRNATVLNALGLALGKDGEYAEAIPFFRNAIELDPTFAPAHYNLALQLADTWEFEEALKEFRLAEGLFAKDDTAFGREWLGKSRGFISKVEQEIESQPDVEAVLAGRRPAASADEWERATQRGWRNRRYRETIALAERTLADEPAATGRLLSEGALYNSACVAALLAAGGDPTLSVDEAARCRRLALEWLGMAIDVAVAELGDGGEAANQSRRRLSHVLKDSDLASVRGPALEKLPAPERAAWQALWKRVEDAAGK